MWKPGTGLVVWVVFGVSVSIAADGAIPLWGPTTITQPGHYVVTRNITHTVNPVISVNSDNVFVDLNGFKVQGDNEIFAADVVVVSGNGVTIANGTVAGGGAAIRMALGTNRFLLRNLSLTDGKSLVFSTGDKSLVLRFPESIADRPEPQEVIRALGLDPSVLRYELVLAEAALPDLLEAPGQRRSLPIATRSLLGTLFYLSQGIDVPEEHTRAGLVTQTVDGNGEPFDWSRVAGDLLRVRVQRTPPGERAAIKVPYRGHWYFIDDADLESKSTFTLLTELFALQSGVAIGNAPVLTLPVGS